MSNEIFEANTKWFIKVYDSLIERCKNTDYSTTKFTEIHHIVPKCMGGNGKKENLVKMSVREHFIAHLLLERIYPDNYKLSLAVSLMLETRNKSGEVIRISSKLAADIRIKRSEILSKSRKGSNNPNYGHKHSEESRKLMSEKLKERNFRRTYTEEERRQRSIAMMGENNPNYNKKLSEETRRKISNSRLGKYTGKDNPFFGKKHSEETKKLLAELRVKGARKVIDSDGNILSIKEMASLHKVSYSTIVYWINKKPEKGIKFYGNY